MSRVLFVSRHPGALEWARRRGVAAERLPHLDVEQLQPGDKVIGTLPVHLAAQVCERGARYLHLTLPLPEHLRGKELTADDMDALGATFKEYVVELRG